MKELLSALYRAKSEIGAISKDSDNPFFKSKYFDINKLIQHVEPVLANHGLMLLQPLIDGKVSSQIYHVTSGQMIESSIDLPQLSDPQKMGSAITYYRRYTLQSLLSLQAEDDDGNKAAGKESKKQEPKDTRVLLTKMLTKNWSDCVDALANKGFSIPDIERKYKLTDEVKKQLQEDTLNIMGS